jgi:NADH-quinone oxidoreductase subunit J
VLLGRVLMRKQHLGPRSYRYADKLGGELYDGSALSSIDRGLTVAGALAAALLKNLVHCALSLTVTFAGLALLYLQLDAQFAGFAQILVYIGAVAILSSSPSADARRRFPSIAALLRSWFVGLVIAAAVFAVLAWAVMQRACLRSRNFARPRRRAVDRNALMSTLCAAARDRGLLLTAALIGAVIVAMPESQDTQARAQKAVRQ